MSGPDESAEAAAHDWLDYARDDLRGAETLLEAEDVAPRLACFHAQQAAEKALKALLVARQVPFPRLHDLVALRALLPADRDFGVDDDVLVELGQWAVEARYPGDLPGATPAEAAQAVEHARVVLAVAEADLEDNGASESTTGRGGSSPPP